MITLTDIVIDCPDAPALANFYAAVTGGTVTADSNNKWTSVDCGAYRLSFQRVDGYQPPQWPGQAKPQQVHIDFEVDDFETEGRRVMSLGAKLEHTQINERGGGFVVYLDPAGHPFCLCRTIPR